jgi:uncharacterized protein (DUF1697 family)
VNWNDANAQWLQQRLKAAPEQTFGIQYTLALLEARDFANNVRHDPAPLAAFAAAHEKDFAQLTPAVAKVVRTLLDRYLKPPAKKPMPKPGNKPKPSKVVKDDPFGALPPPGR